MKIKKILAAIAATALATSALATSAIGANGYDAYLMYADGSWLWGNWKPAYPISDEGYGIDAEITKDGTYTVSITSDSIKKNGAGDNKNFGGTDAATGTVCFCVDITGLMKIDNFVKNTEKSNGVTENGKFAASDIKCTLDSIKQDGKDLKFNSKFVKYGNLENNNTNYRIEIYNDYSDATTEGQTWATNAEGTTAIDKTEINWSKSLEVTFTISGIGGGTETTTAAPAGGEAAATTAAPAGGGETPTSNTDTGVGTGLALAGILVAGGAIVLTKKRK